MASKQTLGICSKGILKISGIDVFLDEYTLIDASSPFKTTPADLYAGWGRRPSGKRATQKSKSILLEDGFLRSVDFIPGQKNPPLSLVLDKQGIYFDASQPSDLEKLLQTSQFNKKELERAKKCIQEITTQRLSKYNNGLDYSKEALGIPRNKELILIIDQVYGDASIHYGQASRLSFDDMIETARSLHPDALLLIKTHPDILMGKKTGYLTKYYRDDDCHILDQNINPHCLFDMVEHVYTATSLMGFEALCAGKKIHAFGQPFYAGWGACAEEPSSKRRTQIRTAEEIFAAAYILYSRYYNPFNNNLSTIENTIDLLADLKKQRFRSSKNYHCVGFKRWKREHVIPFLTRTSGKIMFHDKASHALSASYKDNGNIVIWASKEKEKFAEECAAQKTNLIRMEDGFIRSVGLGSDLVKGASLVLDNSGIYYDPNKASEIENLLNTQEFSKKQRNEAKQLKAFILDHKISKYNEDQAVLDTKHWPSNKEIIFVPGQVDNDASIKTGAIGEVQSNLDLLKAVRSENPDAYILYKPHPDVTSGNRKGYIPERIARNYADEVIYEASIQQLLQSIDSVHTMTSLVGFEALLNEKKATCYGAPFYSGWGLTSDKVNTMRRKAKRDIFDLISAALLCYPSYYDWENNIPADALHILKKLSNDMKGAIKKERTHYQFLRRQLGRAWINLSFTIKSYLKRI